MMKKFLLLLALFAVLAVLAVGCKVTRAGYASAPYKVVSKRGHFEVRDYPELRVAETKASVSLGDFVHDVLPRPRCQLRVCTVEDTPAPTTG